MSSQRSAYTIVGAGFGLYGYLPAILEAPNSSVVLPEEYRQKIESRPDISPYLARVDWLPSMSEALNAAQCVIVAVPPSSQEQIVQRIFSYPDIQALFLEKPLAPNPVRSAEVLASVVRQKKRVRVGYTFLFTTWYRQLQASLREPTNKLRISWLFASHSSKLSHDSWKKNHSAGGGVLRFFGIHVIAVLASLGYETAITRQLGGRTVGQPTFWRAEFLGRDLPPCEVILASDSDRIEFEVQIVGPRGLTAMDFFSESPFGKAHIKPEPDYRVPIVRRLLESLDESDEKYLAMYQATNRLWEIAESPQYEFR